MLKSLALIAALWQVADAARRKSTRFSSRAQEHTLDLLSQKPICDDSLVLESCAAFAGELGARSATAKDIANSLVVKEASVTAFLLKLGLDGQEVFCKDLCLRTAESWPEDRLPPASNLGCHMSGSQRVCDMDLSDQGLAAVAETADPHRFHPANASDEIEKRPIRPILAQEPKVPVQQPHQASFSDLQEEVSQWFGIWPVLDDYEQGASIQASLEGEEGSTGTGGTKNQKEIDRLTVAYLVDTEKKVQAGCSNLMKKWFGSSSSSLKRTLIGGLQFIKKTIQNVHYVNWENEAGYYGWVYPGEKKNGKLVIHLGRSYFRAGMADRVGTLTHEAAHHPPLRRRDRQHRRRDGPKQYCGVSGCLGLAKSEPAEAQLNDDNWSFFIDDVVGQGMNGKGSTCTGGGGGGSPSPSPTPSVSERRRRRRV